MGDVPAVFAMGDDNEYWAGIPRSRALEWTRVFLTRRPSVPGTIIWMVKPNLAKGIPAGFTDWARRAEVAEAIGFTPSSYEALHAALDRLGAARFAAHPDNHPITTGSVPVRPFDADRWAGWVRRVESGMTPDAAAIEMLSLPSAGPGGLLRAPIRLATDELGQLIDLLDYSFASPVVLHAPHAGTAVPLSALPSFTVSQEELAAEHRRLTDHHTDRMIAHAGIVSRVASRLSRLVVDVERFEGDEEEMNAVGMGVLYTHGTQRQPIRTVPEDERDRLLAYFHDYSRVFGEMVDRVLDRHGRAVILDVHSYPAEPLPCELHAQDRRPELCIGVDERHTPRAVVDAARQAFAELDIAVNEPFRGIYVPLRHLGDARVASVMLEIRRDRYLNDDGEADDAAVRDIGRRIREVVARVVASPGS